MSKFYLRFLAFLPLRYFQEVKARGTISLSAVLWDLRRGVSLTLLVLLFFFSQGCYPLVFKAIDEKNIRRQFHVPAQVKMISLKSSPEDAGWFGREGLRITAVFQYNDEQIAGYMRSLNDQALWQPVPFIQYSPDRAQEHTNLAYRWLDLPIPAWDNHLDSLPEKYAELNISQGKYYCSVVLYEQGKKIEHPDGNFHFEWNTRGVHASELPQNASAVITTFGILDLKAKKLYAEIQFSG